MPDKEEDEYSVINMRGPERQRSIPPGESIKVWESPDSLQLPWNDVLSPHPPTETPYRGRKNTSDLLSTSLINLFLLLRQGLLSSTSLDEHN